MNGSADGQRPRRVPRNSTVSLFLSSPMCVVSYSLFLMLDCIPLRTEIAPLFCAQSKTTGSGARIQIVSKTKMFIIQGYWNSRCVLCTLALFLGYEDAYHLLHLCVQENNSCILHSVLFPFRWMLRKSGELSPDLYIYVTQWNCLYTQRVWKVKACFFEAYQSAYPCVATQASLLARSPWVAICIHILLYPK